MSTVAGRKGRAALGACVWASLAGASILAAAFGAGTGESARTLTSFEHAPSVLAPDDAPGGWFARYSRPGAGRGAKREEVRGYSPTGSFALEPGQGVAPGAPIEEFEATFDGTIPIAAAGKYRFGAETEGGPLQLTVFGGNLTSPVTLEVSSGRGDVRMSKWVDLQVGSVNVQYTFTRKANAKVRLRPMWEKQGAGKNGFKAEPIPYDAVKAAAMGLQDVQAWQKAQHGRVLLGELGCVQCHAGAETVTMAHDAPVLGGMAARINPDWAKKWMAAPQALKPGSGMPSVLLGETRGVDADNITQFLLSTGGKFEVEHVATEPASVDIGKRAYNTLGCVSCHGVPGAPPSRDNKSPHPHTNLAGKWNATALSEFLQDPSKTHVGGRMPSFKLNPQEADAVATYLINAWGKDQLNPGRPLQTDPKSAVDLGRQAFASMGCANCHQLGGEGGGPVIASTLKAKPLAQLNVKAGCLDPRDQKTPRYQISADARSALASAITQIRGWTLPKADAKQATYPVDKAHLAFEGLGCKNCHEHNGVGGVDASVASMFVTLSETDLGDEGRLPPRLDGVGNKLNSAWMLQVLSEGVRARPYMAARMPVFGKAHTDELVSLLAQSDGVWPGSDKDEPKVDDAMTQAGRRLVGEKGLNCISCHVVGNNPPAGTAGPDINAFAARLRYEWWADYIHAPVRFKPGTRMPAFFENGISNVTDVLAGDPDQQADAMWAYFTLGEFAPAPEGLIPQGGYKIKASNRPTVIRTFLRDAGSRGIAVGFPETMGGIHFAFDAEHARLVEAWKGDFLDASGAWAGRGGNVTGGQGPQFWKAPGGPAIVVASERPKEWPSASGREAGVKFRGYRMDEKGVPSFMYSITAGKANIEVAERFEPSADGGIKRTFEITGVPSDLTVWMNAGPKSTPAPAQNAQATVEPGDVVGYKGSDASKPIVISVVSKP